MKNIIISISLTFLLIIASCEEKVIENNQKVVQTKSQNTIKIKWLAHWYGEGRKETLIREIARDFSFIYQDYEVELEFPHEMLKANPGFSFFLPTKDSIIRMIETNTWPYDIMLCDAYMYQRIGDSLNDKNWGSKYLENFINEKWFIDAHKPGLFDTDTYTEVFGGIAPGAFIEGVWNILYVSTAVEEKLGIKVNDYNMTIDEFISNAKAVYEYNTKHQDKITFFSLQRAATDRLFSQLILSILGRDYLEATDDPFVILETAYKKLAELAPYKPLEQYVKYGDESRELFHDKMLFVYYPTWISLFWEANNPAGAKQMRPCELPSMGTKKAPCYSGRYTASFVIPKNAKNKDAAIKLMKFICSQETALKWVKYAKSPTGLKARISYSDFGNDKIDMFSRNISQKYNNKLNEVDVASLLFKSNKKIDFAINRVMSGNISPGDAINFVKAQL